MENTQITFEEDFWIMLGNAGRSVLFVLSALVFGVAFVWTRFASKLFA